MKQLKLIITTRITSAEETVALLKQLIGNGKVKEYHYNLGKLDELKNVLEYIKQLENE